MIHHYSRKGMPSLEYSGMTGSSPGDSCLPAAASTAPTALLGFHSGGGCEGQGEGADRIVLWGVDWLPQQAANIIGAGGPGSSLCQAFRAHPVLRVGGFLGGLNHSHHIPAGTQDGPGQAGTCLVHCNTMR